MPFRLANVAGRAALVAPDDQCHDLETLSGGSLGPDPMTAIAATAELHALSESLAADTSNASVGALGEVELGPPIPRPRSVFAVGLNYADHAAESGMELPATPLVFAKFPSCLVGPHADVELRSGAADYEAELVVVIGQGGRDIPADEAWDHVAGVTAGQDISDRMLQFAASPPHFDLGKSRDTYGPIGPVVVSPDALDDRDDLAVRCEVNGEVRQDSSTRHLIFDVPALVAYLSTVLTLTPGDLIFTGTPDGVGVSSGRFLAPGDVITTEIAGIGTLTNRCA